MSKVATIPYLQEKNNILRSTINIWSYRSKGPPNLLLKRGTNVNKCIAEIKSTILFETRCACHRHTFQ